MVDWQERGGEGFCFVADWHSLGSGGEGSLRGRTVETFALLVAAGMDPTRSCVFIQSDNPLHLELYWLLASVVPAHRLSMMTQFKTKRTSDPKLTLYAYPVLMAADVLLYGAQRVSVGADQTQHLELARMLAQRIGLPPPQAVPSPLPRLLAPDDPPRKMSKSDPSDQGRINLLDPPPTVLAKIRRAPTGPDPRVTSSPSPELSNLISILAAISRSQPQDILNRFLDSPTSELREEVAQTTASELATLQEKFHHLMADPQSLNHMIELGKHKAIAAAHPLLKQIKQSLGIYSD